MEWNDIYDENRNLTGRVHRRGTHWNDGEYGLVVCVLVYDGMGHVLLTRRAKGKSFAGTWENSGGAARAGETSLEAIVRELFEDGPFHAAVGDFGDADAQAEALDHGAGAVGGDLGQACHFCGAQSSFTGYKQKFTVFTLSYCKRLYNTIGRY